MVPVTGVVVVVVVALFCDLVICALKMFKSWCRLGNPNIFLGMHTATLTTALKQTGEMLGDDW